MDFDPATLAAWLRGDQSAQNDPNAVDLSSLPNSQGGSFVSGLVGALRSGATLPGDVYNGDANIRLPSESPDLTRVADLAGLAMTGGLAGAGEAGATMGSGPVRSMADLIAETRAKTAARQQAATDLASAGQPVRLFGADGRSAMAGPDMSREGSFRLTRFDDMGPAGHTEHASLQDAIEEGLRQNYAPKDATLGSGSTDGKGAALVSGGLSAQGQAPIRAYHGSPHDFDRFDLSKIGTGEGAQAYGHGLYFAEAEPTAAYYRQQLSGPGVELYRDGTKVGPVPQDARSLTDLASQAIPGEAPGWVKSSVLRAYRDAADAGQPLTPEVLREGALRHALGPHPPGPNAVARVTSDIDGILQSGLPGLEFRRPGHMYEVAIHADPERFLDWDAAIGNQTPAVRDALKSVGIGNGMFEGGTLGSEAYRRAARKFSPPESLSNFSQPGATAALHEAGIPGIKYLDQGSRDASWLVGGQPLDRGQSIVAKSYPDFWRNHAGIDETIKQAADMGRASHVETLQDMKARGLSRDETHNYVVFDDAIVDILRKYGVASVAALPPAVQMMLQGSGSAPSGDLHYPAQ